MTRYDLVEDIAAITNIQRASLDRLVNVACTSMAHTIFESIKYGDSDIYFDVGIGNVFVAYDQTNDSLNFRFEPSYSLNNILLESINTDTSPIISAIDESLINKITSAYKELF